MEGSRVFQQDLPNPVKLGTESESHTRSATELGLDWGLDLDRESEDVKLAFLLGWPTFFSGSLD